MLLCVAGERSSYAAEPTDRWRFNGGAGYGVDLSTAALLLPDGDLLWPGPRHRLFALSHAGALLWTLPAGADLVTPVLDRRAGLLIVADRVGHISGYRLPSGARPPRRVWSRRLASTSYGNPVVAADGTIHQTAGDSLFALSPAGHVRWTVSTPQPVEVSPAIAVNGIVVFGANNRYEYGVDPDGRVRWKEKIGNFTYSSPLTLAGRRVLYGNHSGPRIRCSRSRRWRAWARTRGSGQRWQGAAVVGAEVEVLGDELIAERAEPQISRAPWQMRRRRRKRNEPADDLEWLSGVSVDVALSGLSAGRPTRSDRGSISEPSPVRRGSERP